MQKHCRSRHQIVAPMCSSTRVPRMLTPPFILRGWPGSPPLVRPVAPSRTGVSMASDILCITGLVLCTTSLFLCTIGWMCVHHTFARSRVPKRTGARSSLPCPSISASFPRVGPSRDSMLPAHAATLSPKGKRRARQGRCMVISLAIYTVSLSRLLLRFDCAYRVATLHRYAYTFSLSKSSWLARLRLSSFLPTPQTHRAREDGVHLITM
jgi:hypothetical protein